MDLLKEVHLSHFPPEFAIYIAQFKDVSNAAFLRDQLIAGNAEFEYAFLDAGMILSTSHVLAAVFRAVNDSLNHRLKSRNVHSEIVFCLSPNNNIAESFRRFGVTEKTRSLIAIKCATSPGITRDLVQTHLASAVEGTPVEFNDDSIAAARDVEKIKKVYKLGSFGSEPQARTKAVAVTGAAQDRDLELAVIGTMALRGAT